MGVCIPREQRYYKSSWGHQVTFVFALRRLLSSKGRSSTVAWTSLGNHDACNHEACLMTTEVAKEHDTVSAALSDPWKEDHATILPSSRMTWSWGLYF